MLLSAIRKSVKVAYLLYVKNIWWRKNSRKWFVDQWNTCNLQVYSLLVFISCWPWCSFIADENVLVKLIILHSQKLYAVKYSQYQKMFQIEAVDLSKTYILYSELFFWKAIKFDMSFMWESFWTYLTHSLHWAESLRSWYLLC